MSCPPRNPINVILPAEGADPSLDSPFTMQELEIALRQASGKKAPGPDIIPNSVLKALPENLLTGLLNLFNSCYEAGELPECFGEIEMVMIFKKGDVNLPEN